MTTSVPSDEDHGAEERRGRPRRRAPAGARCPIRPGRGAARRVLVEVGEREAESRWSKSAFLSPVTIGAPSWSGRRPGSSRPPRRSRRRARRGGRSRMIPARDPAAMSESIRRRRITGWTRSAPTPIRRKAKPYPQSPPSGRERAALPVAASCGSSGGGRRPRPPVVLRPRST